MRAPIWPPAGCGGLPAESVVVGRSSSSNPRHRFQEAQPAEDLLQQAVGHRPLALRKLEASRRAGPADGKAARVPSERRHAHREALPAQAGAPALRAGPPRSGRVAGPERLAAFALVGDVLALARAHPQEPLEPSGAGRQRAREPVAVAREEDVGARLLRQLPDPEPRARSCGAWRLLERLPQEAGTVAAARGGWRLPARYGLLVGDHLRRVHLQRWPRPWQPGQAP